MHALYLIIGVYSDNKLQLHQQQYRLLQIWKEVIVRTASQTQWVDICKGHAARCIDPVKGNCACSEYERSVAF